VATAVMAETRAARCLARFSRARRWGDFSLKISSILRRNDGGCGLLFDPWGPARRVCFARGGAPGSAGCHCSSIEQVVEEEMAAEAVQVMVREVRHTLVVLTTRKKATQRNSSDIL
jgi:hypothetical protein